MEINKRDFLAIDDLSLLEIEAIFSLAAQMEETPSRYLSLCRNRIMASLFFEPSTRTRLSFETAMHRLGGEVITVSEAGTSSLAKGESLTDTARVIGSYADMIVVRHPWEGAARVFAEYAPVSVINAGDGGHQHPTQTLCDLYIIKKERGRIKGLNVALCGDLKNARAVHSLAYGLAMFGANIICAPGTTGLDMPPYVLTRLNREYGYVAISPALSDLKFLNKELDILYLIPGKAIQPSKGDELVEKIDVLYVTRVQKERFNTAVERPLSYPVVNKKTLAEAKFRETLVMHPLPRVDELSPEVDTDPRAIYFKQAASGVPVRMALIAFLLRAEEFFIKEGLPQKKKEILPGGEGRTCSNRNCVAFKERDFLSPKFEIISPEPLRLKCVYCEHLFPSTFCLT
ncbi:MAG: aspartate carbamoyltransferase catalytic subunit [bacterium]